MLSRIIDFLRGRTEKRVVKLDGGGVLVFVDEEFRRAFEAARRRAVRDA